MTTKGTNHVKLLGAAACLAFAYGCAINTDPVVEMPGADEQALDADLYCYETTTDELAALAPSETEPPPEGISLLCETRSRPDVVPAHVAAVVDERLVFSPALPSDAAYLVPPEFADYAEQGGEASLPEVPYGVGADCSQGCWQYYGTTCSEWTRVCSWWSFWRWCHQECTRYLDYCLYPYQC